MKVTKSGDIPIAKVYPHSLWLKVVILKLMIKRLYICKDKRTLKQKWINYLVFDL